MEPDRWRQIEQLFHAALNRKASQRDEFLKEACAGDESLRKEVETLLAHHKEGEGFIERPAIEDAAEALAEDELRAAGSAEVFPDLVGRTFSHYRVVGRLGRGGMGEVYRAQDTRLGREVAIKILPKVFSSDPDRLRRFEQEARSASALNHPNIVTIYDIGQESSVPYIAMEMIEGKTLREMLIVGAVPTKKVLQLGAQVADGLAKAHGAGIVHRDLKPENLMVTKDALVKILDFGLAKFSQGHNPGGEASQAVTLDSATQAGLVVGTAGYMSPEQASGHPVDFRSDQFSFGAILFEMTTGKRAFKRATVVETLSAIIQDEPEPVARLNPKAPPPLCWIIERCLAKNAEERYASTRDLARDLQSLREHAAELGDPEGSGQFQPTEKDPRVWTRTLKAAGAALGLLAVVAGIIVLALARTAGGPPPGFQPLTFRHGAVTGARFSPNGETIFYSAAWGGNPVEVLTTRPESSESGSIGLRGAGILAISPSGELAVALGCTMNWGKCIGTLARVPSTGGAPREILEHVHEADWAPDGQTLLAVQFKGGKDQIQYPLGKVLYEALGWITSARFSPKGDYIAFLDHPVLGDISGSVAVIDLAGKKRTLSSGWNGLEGLAWSPSGDEIWFTASRGKASLGLFATSLTGKDRAVYLSPSSLNLFDISRDGKRALILRGTPRAEMVSLTPGASKEHDLAWFDYSTVADLTPDGKALLFYEWGNAVRGPTVYLRKTDGSDAVRLGDGKPLALSPDGKWALALQQTSRPQLILLPTGPGEQRSLPEGTISEYYDWAAWSPDGRQIFFAGSEQGHRPRTYVQEIDGGSAQAVTAEGMVGTALSPDGKLLAAIDRYKEYYLCPVAGGEPRAVEGLAEGDQVIQWAADGRSLFVRGPGDLILNILKLDLATGKRELWKELSPPEPAAVIAVALDPGQIRLTPDGKYYAYTSWTFPGELYLAQGLK